MLLFPLTPGGILAVSASVACVMLWQWSRRRGALAIPGQFRREVISVFESQPTHGKIQNIAQAVRACNDLGLKVSAAQIRQLMEFDENATELGHFSLFVQHTRLCGKTRRKPYHGTSGSRLQPRSRSLPHFQVFLGGSCNPTTWRTSHAIPALKKAGVTFYNPQVTTWSPELVELEEAAKDQASLLFFVLDNQTRGVGSMVEVAYLASCGRPLVVVTTDFDAGTVIGARRLHAGELRDLVRGRDFLSALIHEHGVPLFTDLDLALTFSVTMLRSGVAAASAQASLMSPASRDSFRCLLDNARFLFLHYQTHGLLAADDAVLAIKALTGHATTAAIIRSVLAWPTSRDGLTLDEFCSVVAELLPRSMETAPESTVGSFLSRITGRPTADEAEYLIARDVFLGGSCGTSWRSDIAIPLLREAGFSYFNPQVPNWTPRLMALEAQAKQACSVLLFVVSQDTRAVATMVEAAHYIGQGREVVLCIQNVLPGTVVRDEVIDDAEAKDLNRGRTYLANVANRHNVSVFSNVTDALQCVIEIVRAQHPPPRRHKSRRGGSSPDKAGKQW